MSKIKDSVVELKSCPLCGSIIVRESRDVLLSYKGKDIIVEQPGQYCTNCGESFLNPADLSVTEKNRTDFQREVDHLLKSDEIREIRKKLNLSQRNAGNIFGGGPMAFSKYERGIIKQTRSMDVLFRLISKNKLNLKDILEVEEW